MDNFAADAEGTFTFRRVNRNDQQIYGFRLDTGRRGRIRYWRRPDGERVQVLVKLDRSERTDDDRHLLVSKGRRRGEVITFTPELGSDAPVPEFGHHGTIQFSQTVRDIPEDLIDPCFAPISCPVVSPSALRILFGDTDLVMHSDRLEGEGWLLNDMWTRPLDCLQLTNRERRFSVQENDKLLQNSLG